MKNGINLLLVFIFIGTLAYISYRIGVVKGSVETSAGLTKEIDSLKIVNRIESDRLKKESDSLKIYYSGIDKANEQTNRNIKKLLKKTDEKINYIFTVNDSIKRIIADSILKANGFK